ncbi:TIGR02206 family membrane protein [Paenibacillus lemnae]|uniref:TIGR02206 family membrane protein n=2 Tax=Paenibacillus lemnae TaxID=1330551 RepID=A0A848M8I5_PAELE|nr:TIGR02206 family membrane protein [Paenibacillus lemnae]
MVLILGLFLLRHRIAARPRIKSLIRRLLIAALLLPEAALQTWYLTAGIWDRSTSLPLELCSLTMFLGGIMLLTGNRLLYEILYFAGIGGALQAVLTPNLDYPFPHFRFIHFFIVHMAIILAPLYMTWIEGYRPRWMSILRNMIFLNGAALLVAAVNWAIGSNYMFLMHKPSTPSVLDWLGPHPVYILAEELIALLLFTVMYMIFFYLPDQMRQKRRKKRPPTFSTGKSI